MESDDVGLCGIAICATVLGVACLATGHNGSLIQAIISLFLVIGGYIVGKAKA